MPIKKSIKPKEAKKAPVRLFRSETNRLIGGVCGGLAEFFNVDATLVRIIFVLVTIFGGGGLLLYIILWLIIPTQSSVSELTKEDIRKNAEEIKESAHKFASEIHVNTNFNNSRAFLGIVILILGVMFLFGNLGLFTFFHIEKLWPLILILIGIAFISKRAE